MNDISASHAELPRSGYFNNSLRRARTAAEQRSHRYVTLEHLLYALLDDPDALSLLETMGADIATIRSATSDAINNRMSSLVVPDGRPPSFSYKFDSLMLSATDDAVRLGRREIDGALAVIAIAKDPENNASAFLTANGFNINAALRYLSASRGVNSKPSAQAQVAPRDAKPASQRIPQIALTPPRNTEVDDVLASVRNLLEAGERRERGLPPAVGAALHPTTQRSDPRLERHPPPAVTMGQARQEPRLNQHLNAHPARDEASSKGAKKEQKRGVLQAKISGTTTVSIARLIEHIPRKMRASVPETIEVRLSKEEAAGLFEGVKGQGTAQSQLTRAITIKLSAPEGGFFIETLSPETQWLFDRPSFLGEEAFGRWIYTVVPHESGRHVLLLQVSARDMDETGVARDLAVPEQAVEVRVRANYGHALGSLFRALFLLVAGGAIMEGGLYFLKILGKIPKMPWQ